MNGAGVNRRSNSEVIDSACAARNAFHAACPASSARRSVHSATSALPPHLDDALLRPDLNEVVAHAIADDGALDRPTLARISVEIGSEAMRHEAGGVERHDHAALPSSRELRQARRRTIDRGPA